jgi:hypothetical protein
MISGCKLSLCSKYAKKLKSLSLENNRNTEMTCLHFESDSLITFEVVHFYQIETSQINCPNLREITFGSTGKVQKEAGGEGEGSLSLSIYK